MLFILFVTCWFCLTNTSANQCSINQYSFKVNCTNKKLTEVPWDIPKNTTNIILEQNLITTINEHIFQKLPNLIAINMNLNQITGRIDFLLPPDLRTLEMEYNHIKEIGENFFKNCSHLVEIKLKENLIENLSAKFVHCQNLEYIDFSYNRFKEIRSTIWLNGMKNLKFINFNDNMNISSMELMLLENLCRLDTLFFAFSLKSVNKRVIKLPGEIGKGCNLTNPIGKLIFSKNNIEVLPNRLFYNIKAINDLDLFGNDIVKLPKYLLNNTLIMNYMILSRNKIEIVPDDFFKDQRFMHFLGLSDNRISIIKSTTFRGMKSLREIVLYRNNIKIIESDSFMDTELEMISLFGNNIKELSGRPFVTAGKNLREIQLFQNPLISFNEEVFSNLGYNTTVYISCEELQKVKLLRGMSKFSTLLVCERFTQPKVLKYDFHLSHHIQGTGFFCIRNQTLRSMSCVWCDRGYYGNLIDKCLPCSPGGWYQDKIAQMAPESGKQNCLACRDGTYIPPDRAPGRALSECQVCPVGTNTSRPAGFRACACVAGFHRIDRFGPCRECPLSGVNCSKEYRRVQDGWFVNWEISGANESQYRRFADNLLESDELKAIKNTHAWRYDGRVPKAIRCTIHDACKSTSNGVATECNVGHSGPLCSICDDMYFPWFDTCQKCPQLWVMVVKLIAIMAICFAIVTVLVCFNLKSKRRNSSSDNLILSDGENYGDLTEDTFKPKDISHFKRSFFDRILATFKILVGFYQVVSGIFDILSSVHWPQFLKEIGRKLEYFELNFIHFLNIRCFNPKLKLDVYSRFIVGITGPFAFLVFLFTFYLLCFLYHSIFSLRFLNKKKKHLNLSKIRAVLYRVTALFIFISYPSTANAIFSIYYGACREICFYEENGICEEKTSYFYNDFSQECETKTHQDYVLFAYLSVIYVISVPILLLLATKKSIKVAHSKSLDSISSKEEEIAFAVKFLHENYRSNCWWWEVLEILRKLLLTSILIFVGSDSKTQIGFSALVSFLFVILHLSAKPMKDRYEHWLQLISLAAIVCNLIMGALLLIPDGATPDSVNKYNDGIGMEIFLILVNFSIFFLIIGTYLKYLYFYLKEDNKPYSCMASGMTCIRSIIKDLKSPNKQMDSSSITLNTPKMEITRLGEN